MKISIIAFNDIKLCPYINPYVSFCRAEGIDFEVIYANRSGTEQTADYTTVPIAWNKSKGKIANFLSFRKSVIRYLKRNKRDFVILLTTMPAVLLGSFMKKHYNGRYLVDIRDYTYENVKFFYKREKRAISGAAMNVISSPGFKNFLPEGDYTLCHNASAAYKIPANYTFSKKANGPITIGYVGSIAYKANCRKLIDLIKDDTRFAFHLWGGEVGSNELTEYVSSLGSDRIKAFGAYTPDQKVGIMESVDILFNIYGNDRPLVLYALSNKLYDACYMKLPVLTSSDTSMSEELGDYAFDVDFDDEKILDKLYEWYHAIDGEAFSVYAEKYLRTVFEDQERFYSKLKETVRDASAE